MIDSLLRAKHWQLFLITIGLPFIIQIAMVTALMEAMHDVAVDLTIFFIIMLILTGTFFGWIWAVAMGLQSKVPSRVKMKVDKFKILFFIPLLYMTFIMLTTLPTFNGVLAEEESSNGLIFAVVVPLHLFSIFCILYCFYFVAKTIRTVELQHEAFFSDSAGEFFLIWFYPIGIWALQPRINKLVEDHERIP